jgi:hypothetical protein
MKAVGASLLGSMKGVASIPGRRWRRPCRPAEVQGSAGCCCPIRGPVTLWWWGEALHSMSDSGSVDTRSTTRRWSHLTFPPIWFSLCYWMFFPLIFMRNLLLQWRCSPHFIVAIYSIIFVHSNLNLLFAIFWIWSPILCIWSIYSWMWE